MAKKNIIVAGITRSGLTMTMQMLYAGGYPCAGDYPAFEPYDMKQVDFEKHRGEAVKAVDTHNQFPPAGEYHVIRLTRNRTEQMKSITKMLKLLGEVVTRNDRKRMERNLVKDYTNIDRWIRKQSAYLILSFEDILADPETAAHKLAEFVGEPLDIEKMVKIVTKRSPKCYDGMLEAAQINTMDYGRS